MTGLWSCSLFTIAVFLLSGAYCTGTTGNHLFPVLYLEEFCKKRKRKGWKGRAAEP